MKQYDVAAYIWPSYHYEPRLEHFWPEEDGEWYTMRRGTPRFPSVREIVTGSHPEEFGRYLQKAKDYLDARSDQPPLVTINSWNEWTEGSYLLPDKQMRMTV